MMTTIRLLVVAGVASVAATCCAHAQPASPWMQREMPSRPAVGGIWEPLSLPMRQAEVSAISRRLELTREQRIAFEKRFETYLTEACAARTTANEALAAVDFTIFNMPEVKPSEAEVAKYVRARETFNRELARLEATLFDDVEPMLGEQQKAALPRERLWRDRRRCLTDGSVIAWCSNQQLLVELREVVDELDLAPEQREAVDALVAEFESQATRRILALQEAATSFRLKWLQTTDEEDSFWGPWRKASPAMIDAVQAIIALEYDYRDRIAGLFDPMIAAEFRKRHMLQLDYASGWLEWPMFEIWATTVLGDAGLATDERDALAKRIEEARQDRISALPAYFANDRAYRVAQMIRLNGRGMPVSSELQVKSGVTLDQHQAAMDRVHEGLTELREFVKQLLGEQRGKALNRTANEANNRHNEVKSEGAGGFEPGNVVTMVSLWGRPEIIAPSVLPQADDAVMRALGAGDDLRAIIASVLTNSSDQWRASWEEYMAAAKPLLEHAGQEFDPDADLQQGESVRQRLRELESSAIGSAESIRTVVDDSTLADRLIAANQWAMIATPPRNCPAPMKSVRSSHWPTITSRLDEVNPAAALAASGATSREAGAAWQLLIDAWPGAANVVADVRRAVLDVYVANDRSFEIEQMRYRQMQAGNPQRDDREFKEREKADAAATLAQRLRREHLASLAQLHDRIATTLAPEHAAAYREFVGRAAYPDAYIGLDAAQILLDRALALGDLTPESRRAIEAEWIERHARLLDQARMMEQKIFAYAMASDMTETAAARCAPLYARIEQAYFERDEAANAVVRMLRPILTTEQMRAIEETPLLR